MSPINRQSGTLVGVALLCAAAFTAAGASAAPQDADSGNSLSVKYEEASLSQPGGTQFLYRRIQGAARRVCQEPDRRELVAYTHYQKCFQKAVDDAVAKVNVSTLTAYHRSKTQRSAAG